ncbi:flavin-containing monooxygenase [Nodularia sp. NIES-3585]|uniref:flavin-containing monooxygenase n=1 Tax=Nodularia sp. NIES-3585 TaxID=1973477 RepID=UPI000B5CE274|nr:NAD(P)/FAD-dependent oxidoreductase [Nodularia sp. NIES-3585]GAX35231.1 dimethylaniline monooxygenase [Nodularia sp. NIES-3585]
MNTKIHHICIIGAGISGLVAAKTLMEEGYEVTVFEKQKGLGGVWESSRTYVGLTTQNPRDTYAFTDYPMPASYPEWPNAEQMQNYLKSYAQDFGIVEKIQFQTEVIQVERKTGVQPGWIVSIQSNDQNTQNKYEFDFVLVCNGIFNIPKMPLLAGQDEFIASGGEVLHSTELNDSSQVEGKRIIVVGFGRSATDIATHIVPQVKECTLLFRHSLWKMPKYLLGLVNIKYVLLTRFAEACFPYRHLQGIEWALHTIGKPLVWAFWKLNEILVRLQFGLDTCGMLPDKPLYESVNCSSAVAPTNFYKYLASGKLKAKKTAIARFNSDGVELENGQQLHADVVIFGTGFRQDVPFLPEKYRQMLIDDQGYFHLYRNLIHPDIPQLGFVGYNSSFFSQLTSEIGSWWLAEYVKGNLLLPSNAEMIQDMEAEIYWRQTKWPPAGGSGGCTSPFNFHHLEQLIQDMGVKNPTSGWERIAEVMMPLNPSTYQYIRKELRGKRLSSANNSEIAESAEVEVG